MSHDVVVSHRFVAVLAVCFRIAVGLALLVAFARPVGIFLAFWFMILDVVASHRYATMLAVCLHSIAIGVFFRSVGMLFTLGRSSCSCDVFAFLVLQLQLSGLDTPHLEQ